MKSSRHTTCAPNRTRRALHPFVALLLLSAALVPVSALGLPTPSAGADPAPNASAVNATTPGALPGGVVPDGTCFAAVSATGGTGASSSAGGSGGIGGAGARINATFRVVPGQTYAGTVAAGGTVPNGGSGAGSGGTGGTIVNDHRGGGGGGGSSVSFGGTRVLTAGGGGGGGAAHQATPAGLGGVGGSTGIGAGVVAAGGNGQNGVDSPGTAGGGQGGQSAAGGAGGVQSTQASLNGSPGGAPPAGNGGNGGPDQDWDSGGGGGGGYTGGGGGSSTRNQSVTGAGGGGGSSWVRGTSVDAGASVPTAISGGLGANGPGGSGPGANGAISINWIPCNYDLSLTKNVSSPSVDAGGKVTWSVTVRNDGPFPMTKGDTVDLADTLPAGPNGLPNPAFRVTSFTVNPGSPSGMASGPLTCTGVTVGSSMPAATNCSRPYSAPSAVGAPSGGTRGLDVGESFTISYEQIISNTAPCATITNTATVRDRPAGSPVVDNSSRSLTINCYDLGITKTASPTPTVEPNGTITWTVTVTNNGPGAMEGPDDTRPNPLVVTDTFPSTGVGSPTLTSATGPAGACTLVGSTTTCASGLGSGQSQALTYTQVVNSGTADGTVISNTATVTDPRTGDPNDSSTASTEVNAGRISLTKTAAPDSGVVAGDVVTYTFVAENTGTVGLNGVTITDPKPGLSALTCSPVAGSSLAIGAQMTCTATRTVTQDDVNAGSIDNTATVNATTTNGNPVSATAAANVTADQSASISLVKTPSVSSGVVAGDVVTYSFSGENTGNVTLTDVDVSDPMPGLSALDCTPGTPAVLDPGDTIECSATYTVTQDDVNAGSIGNTATISGLDPGDNEVEDTASATVTADQSASISLVKTPSVSSGVVAGDVVTYSFSGENTGNVTLTDVDVSDPMPGLSALDCTPGTPAVLDPGDTIECSATYTVTQDDVNAGSIGNTATISGLDPGDNEVEDTASATVTADQSASISLVKTPSVSSGVVAGDVVTYSFSGENTGNVTLTDVDVSDPMPGLSALDCTPGTPAVLDPGDTIECSATYTVTQDDVNAGSIGNTATISGLDPGDNEVEDTASATVTADQSASISLVKSASPDSGVVAGDVVTYSFSGENTGNVTLTDVDVSDPMPGLSALDCTPGTPAVLDPGDTIECSATYTVTQDDVNAGSIGNTATITGLDPGDNEVEDTASATVTADQSASISLVKTPSVSSGVVAGDVVTYTFSGENTGNVTLTDVDVSDPMPGLSALDCTPGIPAVLDPGDTIECSATYTVTQDDVNAGSIGNTATISGLDPGDNEVEDTASATVTADQSVADPRLTKELEGVDGSTARWLVTVTNAGDRALTGPFTVTDELPGGLEFESASGEGWACTGTGPVACTHADDLAPGASTSFTVVTTITGTGEITNVVTLDVLDERLEATASYTVPTAPNQPPASDQPSDSNRGGTARATATPADQSPSSLAFTGSEPWRLGAAGLLVFAGGVLILAILRRREDEATEAVG